MTRRARRLTMAEAEELCRISGRLEAATPSTRGRYYVAAGGFGWGIHDTAHGEHPNHPRVEYFTTRDHGSWTGAQEAAVARCAEMNNPDSTLDVESEA